MWYGPPRTRLCHAPTTPKPQPMIHAEGGSVGEVGEPFRIEGSKEFGSLS